ncbi:hypothetical protein Rcae01_02979 [Novipirellula caenicola]|uniref:Uncharacterized protein n=1 Tax=Novipirellula caenicola TaxID=1536901 RepID=A0ABP9VQS0_9BACT
MFEPKCNAASFITNVSHLAGEERLKDERLENGGSDERGGSGHGYPPSSYLPVPHFPVNSSACQRPNGIRGTRYALRLPLAKRRRGTQHFSAPDVTTERWVRQKD